MANRFRQFRLLLWKNFVLQLRRPIGTAVELIVPIALISLLILARMNIDPTDECFESFMPISATPGLYKNISVPQNVTNCTSYVNGTCTANTTVLETGYVAHTVPLFPANALSSDCYLWSSDGNFNTFVPENMTLAYYPYNNHTKQLMETFSKLFSQTLKSEDNNFKKAVPIKLKLQWQGDQNQTWSSEEDIISEIAEGDKLKYLGAVIFSNIEATDTSLPKVLKYSLRLHPGVTYEESWRTERALEFFYPPSARSSHPYRCRFLGIQQALDAAIILTQTGETELPSISMQQFPHPEFRVNIFITIVSFVMALLFVLAFIYSAVMIIKELVIEKQCRLKESMRMMGLANWIHWSAWFVKNFLFMSISLIIIVIILKACKLLEYTDGFVILVMLLLYLASSIIFCFFISVWFSNATLSMLFGATIWFNALTPYLQFNTDEQYATLTNPMKLGMCILPNSCLGIALKHISYLEISQVGVQWDNMGYPRSADDPFKFSYVLVMFLADCFIYGILTWYIENAFPGKFGLAKPFYFPFTKSYWCGSNSGTSTEDEIAMNPMVNDKLDKSAYESEPTNMDVGVSIHNLGKVFKGATGKKVAVDGLSLKMYKGQITSLLGHNGAGKTTTMSVLTGLYSQNSGVAYINDCNTLTQMEEIRDSLGICPQHNILFDRLTVKEHLTFFTNLKGKYGEEADKEVTDMIQNLQLVDKTNWQSSKLSGGMKRKLSCAIALVGGSQTVFLDEPTSGMDPYARRATWDLLLKYKQGKTIVLTTHFMDEADFLGDRIAIMADGQLRCCGSSLFLKTRYGIGYHMTLVKAAECNEENVKNVITRHIPEAKMMSSVGAEIEYILRNEDSGFFEQLFVELEAKKAELGIASFGVSVTTLEEVFMKVGEGSDMTVEDLVSEHTKHEERIHQDDHGDALVEDLSTKMAPNRGLILYFQHFGAMFKKRFLNSIRDKKAIGLQLLLPLVMTLFGLLLYGTVLSKTDDPPRLLKLSNLNAEGISLKSFYADFTTLPNMNIFATQNDKFMESMDIKVINDVKSKAIEVQTNNANFLINANGKTYNSSNPENCCQYQYYVLNQMCKDAFANDTELCKGSEDPKLGYYRCTNNADCMTVTSFPESCFEQITKYTPLKDPNVAFAEYLLKDSNVKTYYMEHISGFVITNPKKDERHTNIWYSNEALHTTPEVLSAYNNILLRSLKNDDSFGIEVTNYPLPLTLEAKANAALANPSTLTLSIFILFGCGFIGASFVVFLVQERTSKAKHIQMVSGVNSLSFWLSTYAWDLINYFVPALIILIMFAIFNIDEYKDNLDLVFLLLILHGWGLLPLVYCLSFLFSNAVIAYALTSLFFSLGGLAMFLAVFICGLIEELKDESEIMHHIFSIIPPYTLATGLSDISTNYGYRKTCETLVRQCQIQGYDDKIQDYLAWERPGIGQHCFYMFLDGIFFFILCLLIEKDFFIGARIRAAFEHMAFKNMTTSSNQVDEDVAREKERVHALTNYDKDAVVLKNMTKVYYRGSGLVAVDHLCLGIPKGECFGLLGVNGAGKTTSFNMLTGDVSITEGTAFLEGYNIQTNLSQVQQRIGYCPQFDALIERMTGREMIHMYASLRGVPRDQIDNIVTESIKHLNLEKWADKMCGDYSGGNKRKLSTAIALVGDPAIIFLDEPTTGMDPGARRFLWDCLTGVMKGGRSIILTSHSMEECEALCTRLAIMVNGQFKCLGGTQHLKSRFGKGYTMMIKVGPPANIQYIIPPSNTAAPQDVNSVQINANTTPGYPQHANPSHVNDTPVYSPDNPLVKNGPQTTTGTSSPLPVVQSDALPSYDNMSPPPYSMTPDTMYVNPAIVDEPGEHHVVMPMQSNNTAPYDSSANNVYLNQPPMTAWDSTVQRAKNFIQQTFPGAILQDEHQGMLHYQVTDDRFTWSYIFGQVERNKNALNIVDYSVSQTTLEQVFLNFAKMQHVEEPKKKKVCCC